MRPCVVKGYNGRLLHYIAKISRKSGTTILPLMQTRFYEKNLSTHTRPCKPGYHTNVFITLVHIARERRRAEVLFEFTLFDRDIVRLLCNYLFCNFTHGSGKLLLKRTHTTLTSILLDDLL